MCETVCTSLNIFFSRTVKLCVVFFVFVFTHQMSSVTLFLYSPLFLILLHGLQGAQEMFNALPCEFVEPHELKEVSRSGGML